MLAITKHDIADAVKSACRDKISPALLAHPAIKSVRLDSADPLKCYIIIEPVEGKKKYFRVSVAEVSIK